MLTGPLSKVPEPSGESDMWYLSMPIYPYQNKAVATVCACVRARGWLGVEVG